MVEKKTVEQGLGHVREVRDWCQHRTHHYLNYRSTGAMLNKIVGEGFASFPLIWHGYSNWQKMLIRNHELILGRTMACNTNMST